MAAKVNFMNRWIDIGCVFMAISLNEAAALAGNGTLPDRADAREARATNCRDCGMDEMCW
jgi:hypothetical protein